MEESGKRTQLGRQAGEAVELDEKMAIGEEDKGGSA